jgi:hypothetical protein
MKILLSYLIAACALAAVPANAETDSGRALAIVAPSEQRTVFDDGGAVVITLAPVPSLAEGDRIVLRVDADQVVVLPPGATKFSLDGVPAGTHVLEALIVDAEDNPVAAAQAVTFLMGDGWRRI